MLPLPANLNGGAQQKVISGLLAKGLVEEGAAGPEDAVWRTDADGSKLTLVATDAAFQALGTEVDTAGHYEVGHTPALVADSGDKQEVTAGKPETADAADTTAVPAQVRKVRADTKQAQLIAMLQQPDGASLDEIAATGWQAHTVRGAISGALRKKLGLTITSEKIEARGRVYRISSRS